MYLWSFQLQSRRWVLKKECWCKLFRYFVLFWTKLRTCVIDFGVFWHVFCLEPTAQAKLVITEAEWKIEKPQGGQKEKSEDITKKNKIICLNSLRAKMTSKQSVHWMILANYKPVFDKCTINLIILWHRQSCAYNLFQKQK